MKRLFILLVLFLSACQPATPPTPISADLGVEFALAPGMSVILADEGLTITLVNVTGDARCPLDIECTESGPVSLTISVEKASGDYEEIALQTFTDNDGRAPEGPFQGIRDRVELDGYVIRVKGVLPYPTEFEKTIKQGEYRVSFIVTK